jgi:hypothetical protein
MKDVQPIVIRMKARNHDKILLHENIFIRGAYNKFDGYKISELNIEVDLKCQEDFDDLIKLLRIHKQCFNSP